MNQRQAQFWVWWLLPVLAARALVPVGFMTAIAAGNFKLVMCSEVIRVASTLTVASSSDQNNSTGDGTHSSTATHALCSFAGSATAPLATTHDVVSVNHQAHIVLTTVIDRVYCNRAYSAHAIRGPPTLLS